MSESNSKDVSQTVVLSSFRQSYQDVAISQKISSGHLKWYVIWAQKFAKEFRGAHLKDRCPEHRITFLNTSGLI